LQSNTYELGLLDYFKGLMSGKRKLPPTPEERHAAAVSVDNYALSKPANLACPVCKNTSTVRQGAPGNVHCNQCAADFDETGEAVQKSEDIIVGVTCCDEAKRMFKENGKPYVQKIPDGVKCNGCSRQSGRDPREPEPRGITRKEYNRQRWRGLGQFALRTPRDRFRR
jgi:hypothetical protein